MFISSIKGNIGHCEAASGAAGLAKLLLMLREKSIPAQAGLENINPHFKDLESSGIIIPRKNTIWQRSKNHPRRAMLNNFGAAGSNTSLLLEEWVQPLVTQRRYKKRSAYLFTLSAKSQAALQVTLDLHLQLLKKSPDRPMLEDICYTATARRQTYDHRISFDCNSIDDLRGKLERSKILNSAPAQAISTIVFVFSGQGALYSGMGEELMYTFPHFKQLIMTCEDIVRGLGYPTILGAIQKTSETLNPVDDTGDIITLHCACVALEYSLAKMLISWGIIPQYVMGHRYVITH
jgi:acyl transferase domain-containing protein